MYYKMDESGHIKDKDVQKISEEWVFHLDDFDLENFDVFVGSVENENITFCSSRLKSSQSIYNSCFDRLKKSEKLFEEKLTDADLNMIVAQQTITQQELKIIELGGFVDEV